jgi:hypothetical protein
VNFVSCLTPHWWLEIGPGGIYTIEIGKHYKSENTIPPPYEPAVRHFPAHHCPYSKASPIWGLFPIHCLGNWSVAGFITPST